MVCSPPIGPEIVRGSITRDRWNVTLRLSYANEVPLGQRSHLYLKIDWQPDQGVRDVDLIFSAQTPQAGGGQIVFNDSTGTNTRRFSGDVEQLVAIYGKSQSPAGASDITLEVKIDDEVRYRIALAVRPVPAAIPTATAFERLRQEMAIAALPTRPTDAAAQRIWDRYTRLFDDARAIADRLGTVAIPTPSVPTIQGTLTNQALTVAELVEHLRSHRSPAGVANAKAKNRTDAFDPFKGHWRGDWRQANDCGVAVNTCQDHLWGATEALSSNPDIYVQQVELGADSRPYTEATPTRTCTAIREVGRDSTLQAINAIHIKTGVIVGAVGVRATADADGLWSSRPHVGFYINPGKLLWVAEENRSSDGTTVTYSLFYEIRAGDPVNQPLYTILAFEGIWNRTNQTFTPNANPKAAQYLKIMTDAERQLERQFHGDRQLELDHIRDAYYRRQLEAFPSATVQEFVSHAPDVGPIRDYLNQLLSFVQQQEALQAAPAGVRDRITYILGEVRANVDHPDPFYIAANHYFTVNPAGVLITNLRSLVAVRDHLDNNPPGNGLPWGEVNIVVHANEEGGMSTPVVPNGRNATPESLQHAIDQGQFDPLSDGLMDVKTTLRIRGCALGQSQRMLETLGHAFGGNQVVRPIVRAPVHLQTYRSVRQGGQLTEAEENPTEFWFVGWAGPASNRPNQATLVAEFSAKYANADVNWDQALQNRVANIEQAIRNRPFVYTFGFTFFDSNPPVLGTSDALRLAWLQSVSDINDDLLRDGHVAADYQWRVNVDQNENLGGGRRRFRIIANGQRTILRLQRDLRGRVVPQFTIDSALQATLMTHTLSQALRDAFAATTMPLSEQAEISILEVNRRWLIQDPVNIRTFLLVLNANQLNVNLEQDFLPAEPVVRAHPTTTDLRHFGENVPARSAQHPLGENVQPLLGGG